MCIISYLLGFYHFTNRPGGSYCYYTEGTWGEHSSISYRLAYVERPYCSLATKEFDTVVNIGFVNIISIMESD